MYLSLIAFQFLAVSPVKNTFRLFLAKNEAPAVCVRQEPCKCILPVR